MDHFLGEDPQIPKLGFVSQFRLWCLDVGKYADQPYLLIIDHDSWLVSSSINALKLQNLAAEQNSCLWYKPNKDLLLSASEVNKGSLSENFLYS